MAKTTTCKQALMKKGILVFPTVEGEFVAYKPVNRDGSVKMDFNIEGELEALDFYDYEEIAGGRALYVMGDVNSKV